MMVNKMINFLSARLKPVIIVVATFLLINCSLAQDKRNINQKISSNNIGWLHGNCLAIKNAENLEGRYLTIIKLLDNQEVSQSIILKKTSSSKDCYALLEDREKINNDFGRSFYTISSKNTINLAIGIVNPESKSFNKNEILDMNNDGKKDTFSYCSTSEGIQFNSWSGIAYKSDSIWSDYYYLGYDTEGNCPLNDNN